MHVTKGQDGGGLHTFCTHCLDRLGVSEETVLADRYTHANANIPAIVNPFAAVYDQTPKENFHPARKTGGGISTPPPSTSPSSSSSSPSSSSLPSPSCSPRRPACYLGHRKRDESPWRDCSSLFRCTRRNRLPPGQPSAKPITRTAEGELPPDVRGATPAAVDVRARWCSHQRRVSFSEYRDTSNTKFSAKRRVRSILKTESGWGISSRHSGRAPSWPSGSLIFPVLPKKEGWDGWSTPPPEPGPTRSSGEKDSPTPAIGEGNDEGEGEEPPRTFKSGFFARSMPKMAGAMAVFGIAATIGVMVLRRRR